MLGTLYLAALSHEVRGVGIPQWPELAYPITADSLGYGVEELRDLAIDTLNELRFLEMGLQAGPGGFGSLLNVQLAITCVETMSTEVFQKFDDDYRHQHR